MRSLWFLVACLCLLNVVKGRTAPTPRSSLDIPSDPRIATLFTIAGELGFPHEFADSWVGDDPCIRWYGIECTNGTIESIIFMSMNLSGTISPKFAELTDLSLIDLSNSSLTGTIPAELLTKLSKLSVFDVSHNKLHGKVQYFESINIEGNPQIEVISETEKKKKIPTAAGISIGIVIGFMFAGVIAGLIYYVVIRKKSSFKMQTETETIELQPQQPVVLSEIVVAPADDNAIPLHILREATADFSDSNIIGRGGFGVVYRGKLSDGTDIAVKKMDKADALIGIDAFKCEVSVLTKVHHRNLVVLLGYCLEGEERLLIYQLMHQGSLSKHLYHWRDHGLDPLDWTKRLEIALDVARGLEYLHTLSRQNGSYIHRDLKPTNILLGDDLRAKVSDFGLVRLTPEGEDSFSTKKFAGTIGYLPPEYTRRITRKLDVYSFGVILMELISGKKAVDKKRSVENPHIGIWFMSLVGEEASFAKVIDKTIEVNEEKRGSIYEVAKLAGQCFAKTPEQRPDMSYAVAVLASLTEQWKPSDVKETKDEFVEEFAKKWHEKHTALEGSSGPSSPCQE